MGDLELIATRFKLSRQREFVEPHTFGQGTFGERCRICLGDDYRGELVHEPWCENVRETIIRFVERAAEDLP